MGIHCKNIDRILNYFVPYFKDIKMHLLKTNKGKTISGKRKNEKGKQN